MPDTFWFDDYKVLLLRERITEFVPTSAMTLSEKLNALVRFCGYAAILLFLYTTSYVYLYICPIGLLLSKLIHDYGDKEEMVFPKPIYSSSPDLPDLNPRTIVDGQECVPPTQDNPFMNVLLSDYKYDPQRPAACPIENPEVKKDALDKFYDNLFQDADDVFGRNTMSRQFYTMPNTEIVNDQTAFAKMCFGDMGRCKAGDMNSCNEHDLRAQRPKIFEESVVPMH